MCRRFGNFLLYFKRANRKFATHSISDEKLNAELKCWAGRHWLRTVFVMAAFLGNIIDAAG